MKALVETLSSPECNEYMATLFSDTHLVTKAHARGAGERAYKEEIFSSSCSGEQYWR
jgi:hypothetical protein